MTDDDSTQTRFGDDNILEELSEDTGDTETSSNSDTTEQELPSRERLVTGGGSAFLAFGVIIFVRWVLASAPYTGSTTTQYAVLFITWTRSSDRLFLEIVETLLFTQFHIVLVLFGISGYILFRGIFFHKFTNSTIEKIDSILGLSGVLLFFYLIVQIIFIG